MELDRIVDLPRRVFRRGRADLVTPADHARDAGQWERAAQLYRKALDREPRSSPIWVQYGHALKESGELRDPKKLAQAELAYRRALSLDPGIADTYLQLGHAFKLQGKTEDAQAAYLRAFALDTSFPFPLDELRGLGWSEAQIAELRVLSERDELGALHPECPADLAAVTPLIRDIRARIEACGLFNPEVYLSLNEDVASAGSDAWDHFLRHGLSEARHFTNPAVVGRLLAQMDRELKEARERFVIAAEQALKGADHSEHAALFYGKSIRIGVFWNSEGNFFIREIAELLVSGLRAQGIEAVLRDQTASREEQFGLRVFVAPHEFYILGEGRAWKDLAGAPNTVLYNTEQVQTHWFCLAFPLLLNAPLVLDINFQTAEILRRAGCKVVHFMPGHLPATDYTQPCVDVSRIELLKGYPFAKRPFNWLERNDIGDRPIDVLFIGSHAARRDRALSNLRDLSDLHRFVCVYTSQRIPLREGINSSTSTAINCALGQRTKIVLNIHRDWLGYFEWSRMVMQGFWQGACVVSDPSLPNPVFEPRVHYLEENIRQIGELIRWLLETGEGRQKLDATRMAGYKQACSLGSMRVALAPVLAGFARLLAL
jgi:hypothetical protein